MKAPIPAFWLYVCLVALLVLLGLSYVFEWTALLRILPWAFILLCPLMMLMGGHGSDKNSSHAPKRDDDQQE